MLCGLVWLTVFPLAASRAAFQASLEFSPVVVPILSAMCRMYAHLASRTAMLWRLVASLMVGMRGR